MLVNKTYLGRTSRKKFENRLNQYIIEYERKEDQDTNDIIETLIIDYDSDDFS
jgi:hypothetical protein